MKENYVYPLFDDWTTDEIIIMVDFFAAVEKVYTTGIKPSEFAHHLDAYRQVEPSKMRQKQLDRQFQAASGLSIYQAIKAYEGQQSNKLVRIASGRM